MSWPTKAFLNLIEVARAEREDALPDLRRMLRAASEKAPAENVIRISETILEIGEELSAKETEAN